MDWQLEIVYAEADAHFMSYVCGSLGPCGIRCTPVDSAASLMSRLDLPGGSLIVIDEQLPDASGTSICSQVRRRSTLPIVLTVPRGNVDLLVRGLEVGVDDALAKPFDPRELAARIRAVLRRKKALAQRTEPLQLGRWTLDIDLRQLSDGDERRDLTGMEFRLLQVLLRHANQPVDRDTLAMAVRRMPLAPLDRYIDNLVCKVRQKLDDNGPAPSLIKTFRGEGYVLCLAEAQALIPD